MAEINTKSNKTKVIAFYLPQYHCIPENDAAWGEGFTEWTNVKKAKPYFNGHYQPRVPLNKNYYNLLAPSSQEWQSKLAKKYSVFGFCYYHYWFKNGKMLLEKPAENMLNNKNINEPFCFCWANESWSKTWTGNDTDLIVVQDYGGKEDWKKHFLYLLPFFSDDRYITFNGKPVFIIYKPELIPDFSEMISFFRNEAQKAGFSGLEIMVQFPTYLWSKEYDVRLFDHYIDFEPAFTTYEMGRDRVSGRIRNGIVHHINPQISKWIKKIVPSYSHHFDYDEVWTKIIERQFPNDKFLCGGFTDWDNSSRKRRSVVFDGSNPQKFEKYISLLCDKALDTDANVIFLDAWNEWGEGAYLEPDEKYGYGYLNALLNALNKCEDK